MKRYRWEEYAETQADGTVVMKWRQIVETLPMPDPKPNPNVSDEVRARRLAAVDAVRKAYNLAELEELKERIYKDRDEWGQ